jgi:hypothetical protein
MNFPKTLISAVAGAMLAISQEVSPSNTVPDRIKQPVSTKESLYSQAQEALPLYEKFMGAVSKDVDGAVYTDFFKALDDADAGIKGPMVVIAPIKSEASFMRKVMGENGGVFDSVGDLVRGMVMVDTLAEIPQVIAALKKEGAVFARPVKDRINKPTPAGYRDVMMNIVLPNGHIAEVQVNTKAMVSAKEREGHKLYEQERDIKASATMEKRDLSDSEKDIIDRLRVAQKEVYTRAWEKSIGIRKSERARRKWVI